MPGLSDPQPPHPSPAPRPAVARSPTYGSVACTSKGCSCPVPPCSCGLRACCTMVLHNTCMSRSWLTSCRSGQFPCTATALRVPRCNRRRRSVASASRPPRARAPKAAAAPAAADATGTAGLRRHRRPSATQTAATKLLRMRAPTQCAACAAPAVSTTGGRSPCVAIAAGGSRRRRAHTKPAPATAEWQGAPATRDSPRRAPMMSVLLYSNAPTRSAGVPARRCCARTTTAQGPPRHAYARMMSALYSNAPPLAP